MNNEQELENLLRRIYAMEHNFKGIRTEVRLIQGDIKRLMDYLQPPKGSA